MKGENLICWDLEDVVGNNKNLVLLEGGTEDSITRVAQWIIH